MKWLGRIGRQGRLGLCLILWSAVSTVFAAEHADVFAALNSIHVGELKQHVDYLASDDLEGREAGAAGGQTAGDYLIQLLQENGVQGAGDAGSYVQEFGNGYRNILGWIEGSDPELKHQYVLVGAHYDHVGYGTQRNSFGPIGHVHNGADDNASGSSGLAEVMQAFALLPTPPKRSVLFVWWDAEEKGMLGSKYWAANPTIDLENLTCVFNMDMIGRLRDERIEVYGVRTGYQFRQLVSRENVQPKLAIDFIWDTKANSDHYPFFRREIPFLMLHTGLHDDYHRPRDDAEKINGDGMQLVARLLFRLVLTMADRPDVPVFRTASRYESEDTREQLERSQPDRPPRLGVSWAVDDAEPGLLIRSVTLGSAADAAGILAGDRLVSFDGRPVDEDEQFPMIVLAARNPAKAVLLRSGEEQPREVEVQLPGLPVRVGISWRYDEAEPGSVVISQVTKGSAAFLCGLLSGDRIYEVNNERFGDEKEFRQLITADVDQIPLLVERRGRISPVMLQLLPRQVTVARPSFDSQPAENVPALAP